MLTSVELHRRLDALRSVRLNWAETPDDIWDPGTPHVEGLQPEAESALLGGMRDAGYSAAGCPLGLALQGRKGVGKSHLLGWVRRQINNDGGYFFLVQYLAGTEFWRSALQGILDGLLRRVDGRDEDQLTRLLTALATRAGCPQQVERMVSGGTGPTRELLDSFVAGLRGIDRQVGTESQDTARALVLYGSTGPEGEIGHALLSAGHHLEADELLPWGIRSGDRPAQLVLRDLSRLLALTGPSVLAVDQIDTLLAPYVRGADFSGPAGEPGPGDLLLDRIADGLMSLREETRRTLSVVTCLPTSWEIIRTRAVDTVADRFRVVVLRDVVPEPSLARDLVAGRLAGRYAEAGFTPPHPTWPVLPQAFDDAGRYTARGVLRRVDEHVTQCLARGEVSELHRLDPEGSWEAPGAPAPGPAEPVPGPVPVPGDGAGPDAAALDAIDARFDRLRLGDSAGTGRQETGNVLREIGLDHSTEDRIVPELLETALACLAVEQRAFGHGLGRDPRRERRPALHARLRLVLDAETEDELHWAFRAVLAANARAVQTRVRNAQVGSGLTGTAPGSRRRLVLLRNEPWPNGRVTGQVLEAFRAAGGVQRELTDRDLRTLVALRILTKERPPGLDEWLVSRRPASSLGILRDVLEDLEALGTGDGPGVPRGVPRVPGAIAGVPSPRRPARPAGAVPAGPVAGPSPVPVGHDLRDGRPVAFRLEALRRHVVVFAGSGSGKTVLLRRLVEECALRGVSSVVLDVNNDLARLGDPWPEPPQGWGEGDAGLARAYLRGTEVVVWTPARPSGRALSFRALADFTQVRDDTEELSEAVRAAVASLVPRAGLTGRSRKAEWGRAVLHEAVEHLAREGSGNLSDLIDLLRDLPDGVSEMSRAGSLAREAAESLAASRVNDRLFDPGTEPTDVGSLLTPSAGRTARVSVISLAGLVSDEERQGFVNQLQMALFGWIKQNPARDRPLRGLLVMDEAQNYAPAGRTTPCSGSTVALAAQARKYGLGLVFATQAPRGLDNKIPGNASTQFFGFLNAPAQIEAAKAIAAARGGRIEEIGHLRAGSFFVSGEGTSFRKISAPFCLSHHPPEPLTIEEVLARASGSVRGPVAAGIRGNGPGDAGGPTVPSGDPPKRST